MRLFFFVCVYAGVSGREEKKFNWKHDFVTLGLKTMECYRIDTIKYEEPMFPAHAVSATYVLTMENSTRDYRKNLDAARPTQTVHIQVNKGYRSCPKHNICDQKSHYDLSDAVYRVFVDARERGYHNILVLEDDFFFRDRVSDADTASVSSFVATQHFDCYSLGCLPIVSVPSAYSPFHLRFYYFGGAHAMIFSPHAQKKYIRDYSNDACSVGHVDMYYSNTFRCHGYFKPLAYQLFEKTENYENWLLAAKLMVKLAPTIDRTPEPWFSICYAISVAPFVAVLIAAVVWALRQRKK